MLNESDHEPRPSCKSQVSQIIAEKHGSAIELVPVGSDTATLFNTKNIAHHNIGHDFAQSKAINARNNETLAPKHEVLVFRRAG